MKSYIEAGGAGEKLQFSERTSNRTNRTDDAESNPNGGTTRASAAGR